MSAEPAKNNFEDATALKTWEYFPTTKDYAAYQKMKQRAALEEALAKTEISRLPAKDFFTTAADLIATAQPIAQQQQDAFLNIADAERKEIRTSQIKAQQRQLKEALTV